MIIGFRLWEHRAVAVLCLGEDSGVTEEGSLGQRTDIRTGPGGISRKQAVRKLVGCACSKPSGRRKAWRGGSWQSGLGRAVSCLMWLEPSERGCSR